MKIYIAGPYMPKDCSLHDAPRLAQKNVDKAIDAFHNLKRLGHEPFVPHLSHYLHLRGEEDYEEWWYEYDFSFLDDWAEGIYMLDGWEKSKGATLEKERAEKLGLVVLYQKDEGEARYNCPTCRWNCPPGARDELCMARGTGKNKIQVKHCDYWEEK